MKMPNQDDIEYESIRETSRARKHPGVLVSLEGPERVGKSTQVKKLCEWLQKKSTNHRFSEVVETREPGGTKLGEDIRNLLMKSEKYRTPKSETLLIFAARNQHIEEKILPSLRDGGIVVTDRYDLSTRAYQHSARGVDYAFIRELEKSIQNEAIPNLTIYLRSDKALEKATIMSEASENPDFFEKLKDSFDARSKRAPKRIKVINIFKSNGKRKSITEVQNEIRTIMMETDFGRKPERIVKSKKEDYYVVMSDKKTPEWVHHDGNLENFTLSNQLESKSVALFKTQLRAKRALRDYFINVNVIKLSRDMGRNLLKLKGLKYSELS